MSTSLITNNSVVITWRQPVRPNGKQEDGDDDVNNNHINDDDHVDYDDKEEDKSLTFLWQG